MTAIFLTCPLSYYQIAARQEQGDASAGRVGCIVEESSPVEQANTKHEGISRVLQVSANGGPHQGLTPPSIGDEFHIEGGCEVAPSVEHQFIPSFSCKSLNIEKEEMTDMKNLSRLRGEAEADLSVSLQLGKRETKRRKQSDSQS